MDRLLEILLRAFIRRGNLRLTTASGKTLNFGDGTGEPVAIRITSKSAQFALIRDPELKFGELYMDGSLLIEQGTIAEALQIVLGHPTDSPQWSRPQWLIRFIRRRIHQFNPRARSRKNVAHHYDLDGQLY